MLVVAALLLAALGAPGAARADLTLKPGQEVALTIDAAVGVGGLVSLLGNAVTLSRGQPDRQAAALGASRSWIISGYVLGTINTVLSPLLLVYGRDPSPTLGLALGGVHGAIGITNLALAIANGVRYARLRPEERGLAQRRPRFMVAPLLAQDGRGGAALGAALSLSRF